MCEGHRTGLPCLPLDDDCAVFFFPAFALLLIFSVGTPPPFLPPPLENSEKRFSKLFFRGQAKSGSGLQNQILPVPTS